MPDSKPAAQDDLPAGKAPEVKSADPADERRERAELERRLGELLARQGVQTATVRLKVESPHSAVTFGGITVGTDYTDVPALAAADLVSEAAAAGVTITQES